MKNLKHWQKLCNDCNYMTDSNNTGKWCNKLNLKCSYKNCPLTPPTISYGNDEKAENILLEGANNLTARQLQVLKYRNEGLKFSEIANRLNIKSPSVYKLYTKAICKTGGLINQKKNKKRGLINKLGGLIKGANKHHISLHNDSISFEIDCNWNDVMGDIIKLKYSAYKLIKYEDIHLQVFHKKLVIKFRKEIIRPSVQDCYNAATQRIQDYIKDFKLKGITKIFHLEQLSRHYAILDTHYARRVIKEGRRLFIYDPSDGKLRKTVDFSDKNKPGGAPHMEYPHLKYGQTDSEKDKAFFDDITFNNYYLPSQTKSMLDTILSVQQEYAIQIKKHLLVQDETLKTLKMMQKMMNKKEKFK